MAETNTELRPWENLSDFVLHPRYTALTSNESGSMLVATVTTANKDGNGFCHSLWQLPTVAGEVPRRLTPAQDGLSLLNVLPCGDVIFSVKRDGDDDGFTHIYRLPFGGGEAYHIAQVAGPVLNFVTTQDGNRGFFTSTWSAGAKTVDDQIEWAKQRKEGKVSGILHSHYPIRYWDQDLPGNPNQIFTIELGTCPHNPGCDAVEYAGDSLTPSAAKIEKLTDLPNHLRLENFTIDGSGKYLLATVKEIFGVTSTRTGLYQVDTTTGSYRCLLSHPDFEYMAGVIDPDGKFALVGKTKRVSRSQAVNGKYYRLDLSYLTTGSGEPAPNGLDENLVELCQDFDDLIDQVQLRHNGNCVFIAPYQGASQIHRLDTTTGKLTRLTEDRLHFSNLCVTDRGIFALADTVISAPRPVRITDADEAAGKLLSNNVVELPSPVPALSAPVRLTEVTATGDDGVDVRAWLVLPTSEQIGSTEVLSHSRPEDNTIHRTSTTTPYPLLTFIHGGPWGTWNSWTWRWNPAVAATRGYAVLLPDPAISTGYGQKMVDRSWHDVAELPYSDVMHLVDATIARNDIDATRTAALGGSFGGYMANWIAGHTDRFQAIVSHAGLYNCNTFRVTTDTAYHWFRHFDDAHNASNNPSDSVENIVTPMLITHGDMDYRVPIDQALELWADLNLCWERRHSRPQNIDELPGSEAEFPHKFLYFPDENHWILKPNNSKLWYATVLAFVDHHLLGKPWEPPNLCG